MKKLILPVLLITGFGNSLFAKNYYIDAIAGNDSYTGLTAIDAWKSLDKVNNTAFLPGDSVLFKRNCVWFGGLNIYSAGDPGKPIVFSAFGMGDKPLIHGGGVVQAGIFIRNSAQYLIVDGFAVTNFDGLDIFDGAENTRCGIQIGEWSGELTSILVSNNEVYFVEGCSNHPNVGSPRGGSLDLNNNNLYQNAGIFCHATNIDALTISGNYVHDCTCTGIFAFQFESATNLLIRQNSVYNIGSDGIVILHATSPLVELNACIKAGNNSGADPRTPGELGFNGLAVAGIWSFGCSDPVFQYNYCEATKRITWDGQPWDFDLETTGNGVYQYNYSRDNEGGFNLGGEPNQVFRYNISYNDGAKQGNAQYFFNSSPTYHNNVFYRTDGQGFLFNADGAQAFQNNIFFTESTAKIPYQDGLHAFDNNCFYGHIPVSPGENPIISDPLFQDSSSPGKILPGVFFTVEDLRIAVSGFKITAGSSCIDAGTDLVNNTGSDFWGNPIQGSKPDIGVYESPAIQSGLNQVIPESSVLVYPNPVSTDFKISLKPTVPLVFPTFKLYNAIGEIIRVCPISAHETSLERGALPCGIYFYRIEDGYDVVGSGKVIFR